MYDLLCATEVIYEYSTVIKLNDKIVQLKRRVQAGAQYETTSAIVNRIIRLTIETGSLTGIHNSLLY